MNVSLYQAASALQAMDRWQETIAANLAASAAPGYRKQEVSFAAVQAGLLGAGDASPVLMPVGATATNFSPGEFRVTGVKSDLAIEGKAFFEVQLPNGNAAYTRDGEFHVNERGELVTKQGWLVAGEGGPLQLDLNNPKPMGVSPSGELSQGGDRKGRVRLVEFNDPALLTRLSGGLFAADHPALRGEPARASTVLQGSLETANVSPVTEMARLMTAMRTFEANQRVVQIHDEQLNRAIRELAPVS
jgi:flagellar basal body rod protein FlgG